MDVNVDTGIVADIGTLQSETFGTHTGSDAYRTSVKSGLIILSLLQNIKSRANLWRNLITDSYPLVKISTVSVLYEYGPMKTHSVYMAYIVVPGLRDPRITLVDTLQRVANAAKKDALLVQVVANGMNKIDLLDPNSFERMEITEMIVRRRERIFDKPAEESEPDPLPPARMVPRAVLNSDAQNSAESSSPAAFVPRVPYGIRPQRGAFRYPTVYMGVRRVFRGRSLTLPNGGNRGNFRGIPSRPGFFRPPMFISRNSRTLHQCKICSDLRAGGLLSKLSDLLAANEDVTADGDQPECEGVELASGEPDAE